MGQSTSKYYEPVVFNDEIGGQKLFVRETDENTGFCTGDTTVIDVYDNDVVLQNSIIYPNNVVIIMYFGDYKESDIT